MKLWLTMYYDWNDISPEFIIRGFKKCCVLKDVNGTDGLVGYTYMNMIYIYIYVSVCDFMRCVVL
jgi:hypothetical protein